MFFFLRNHPMRQCVRSLVGARHVLFLALSAASIHYAMVTFHPQAYNQQKLANRVISLLIERCNCAKRGVYIVAGLKVSSGLSLFSCISRRCTPHTHTHTQTYTHTHTLTHARRIRMGVVLSIHVGRTLIDALLAIQCFAVPGSPRQAWMRHRGLPAGYMRDGIMTEAEEAALITDLEKIGHSFD